MGPKDTGRRETGIPVLGTLWAQTLERRERGLLGGLSGSQGWEMWPADKIAGRIRHFVLSLFVCFSVLGPKPKASCMLGKHSK